MIPISESELLPSLSNLLFKNWTSLPGNVLAKPSVKFSLNISRAQERLGWTPGIGIHQGLEMLLREQYLADPRQVDS